MDTHAIVVADTKGVIQMWSRGAEMLFGYGAGDAVGHSLDLIVPESFRGRHWAGFYAAMGKGESKLDGAATEIQVARKDGTVVPFAAKIMLVRDAAGVVVGVMVVFSAKAE